MPQPNLVPVMPSTSRSTQRSGMSSVTETSCSLPFTKRFIREPPGARVYPGFSGKPVGGAGRAGTGALPLPLPDILVPQGGMGGDPIPQEADALRRMEVDDLHPVLGQPGDAAGE